MKHARQYEANEAFVSMLSTGVGDKYMANKGSSSKGPQPKKLKIDKDWQDAMKEVLNKKRPKDGWPKPEKKKSNNK